MLGYVSSEKTQFGPQTYEALRVCTTNRSNVHGMSSLLFQSNFQATQQVKFSVFGKDRRCDFAVKEKYTRKMMWTALLSLTLLASVTPGSENEVDRPLGVAQARYSGTRPQKTKAPTFDPSRVHPSEVSFLFYEECPPARLSHQLWDQLLQQFVGAAGRVDYRGLKDAEATLDKYLAQLATHVPTSEWDRAATMAYWINAYNAFTIKLILDHYPVASIRDIHGGKPWDVRWIELGGKKYSLNQIEHDILRKRFQDARIHFAVNCAARSCPPLYNRAFTADNLESALEQRARAFINDPQYNRIRADRAELSKIFEWYRKDFGDLSAYINRYSEVKLRPGARITFLEYDWRLNE